MSQATVRYSVGWRVFRTLVLVVLLGPSSCSLALTTPSHKTPFGQRVRAWQDATTQWIIRHWILDNLKDSTLFRETHQQHIHSNTVMHLFQSTPLAKLDNALKLQFVQSTAGRFVERVMREEQEYLSEWKVQQIVQAAGDYNATQIRNLMQEHQTWAPIVVYSFVDCPWCVATQDLLERYYGTKDYMGDDDGDDVASPVSATSTAPISPLFTMIELEPLAHQGKAIRAEIALQTQRTSLPSIWIRGQPIGGYTDGLPCWGPGLLALHESGEFARLVKKKTITAQEHDTAQNSTRNAN